MEKLYILVKQIQKNIILIVNVIIVEKDINVKYQHVILILPIPGFLQCKDQVCVVIWVNVILIKDVYVEMDMKVKIVLKVFIY